MGAPLAGINWESIKLSAVAGVPYQHLATKYGILDASGKPDTTAIRQRAHREHWPIPSRVQESAKRAAKEMLRAAHLERQRLIEAKGGEAGDGGSVAAKEAGNGEGRLSSEQIGNGVSQTVTNGFSAEKSGRDAAVTVAGYMAERSETGILAALDRAVDSLEDAPARLPISSMADVSTALGVILKASGKDKPDVAVQVQLWQSPAYRQASQPEPFDVEPLDEP